MSILLHLLALGAFCLIIVPLGIVWRLFGYDPLQLRTTLPGSYWKRVSENVPRHMRNQL